MTSRYIPLDEIPDAARMSRWYWWIKPAVVFGSMALLVAAVVGAAMVVSMIWTLPVAFAFCAIGCGIGAWAIRNWDRL